MSRTGGALGDGGGGGGDGCLYVALFLTFIAFSVLVMMMEALYGT